VFGLSVANSTRKQDKTIIATDVQNCSFFIAEGFEMNDRTKVDWLQLPAK